MHTNPYSQNLLAYFTSRSPRILPRQEPSFTKKTTNWPLTQKVIGSMNPLAISKRKTLIVAFPTF